MSEGKPLSARSRRTVRTLEGYLANSAPPRWMERIMQIENGIRRVERELGERYELACAAGHPDFSERWRATVASLRFDELNTLIEQHNEYFPIERDLPVNPLTGEFILVHGRDWRRPLLDADWVLERFPA